MMIEPKGIQYHYFDEKTHTWKIKEEAPDWAKKEFEEFRKKIEVKLDENGIVMRY